jgi:hypothetical protein
MNAMEETASIPSQEPNPPETPEIGNPPLEDAQLEGVAGGSTMLPWKWIKPRQKEDDKT